MLMANFKTAEDLGITEPQKDALIKTLVLLETGKLKHVPGKEITFGYRGDESPSFTGHFNMGVVALTTHCGTVACIKGTAELIGNVKMYGNSPSSALHELFYTNEMNNRDITTAQAATALRSYLTTGSANWEDAVR